MDITQDHKNEVERKIVEVVIAALENNNLQQSELPSIGDFVLGRIDAIKTQGELLNFLSELSLKWAIFKNIEMIEKGEAKDQKEDKVAENVLNLAKQGNINDAISLAKTMTES